MPISILAILASATTIAKLPPKPAIGSFASVNYAITFEAPPHTTFCPLPDDFAGSDHGTLIFLKPSRICEGAGYPSSSRGFRPNVPRFELYYGYTLAEYDAPSPAPPCRRVGGILLLGKERPLCRQGHQRWMVLETRAKYSAGSEAELVLSLVTTPPRLTNDLVRFRRFAGAIRTCKQSVRVKGKLSAWGTGQPCPIGSWY